jgi:SAM-dependent methyltransferase
MAKARPYYAPGGLSARFYDAVTAADARLVGDEEIYAALAPPGGSILELGAGSGRLTAGLASRGFHVTGVEIAPAMLAQAEARRAGLPPEVQARMALRRGDMTALALAVRFDLVICPYFTLAHVPSGAAWKRTFETVARHLAPGARAAFHLPRREVMAAGGSVDPARPVLDLAVEGGRLRLFLRERTWREDIGRLEQVLNYVWADGAGRELERSSERLTYYMADPQPFATAAGLAMAEAPTPLGEVGDVWVYRDAFGLAARTP